MKKFIAVFLFLSFSIYGISQDFVFTEKTDLNSDNIQDEVSLIQNDDLSLTLTVNNISKNFEFEFDYDEVSGFKIIDLNKNDVFREIEINASGPGGENFIKLFWFNGKGIHFINTFKASLIVNGNGIVYADNWEGFWTRRRKFTLNKSTHTLTETPQFAYYVGIKNITVKNYVSIYADEELTKKTATLSKNSKIQILLCKKDASNYLKDLYLIKSKSGLIGWIKYSELEKNCSGFNFAG